MFSVIRDVITRQISSETILINAININDFGKYEFYQLLKKNVKLVFTTTEFFWLISVFVEKTDSQKVEAHKTIKVFVPNNCCMVNWKIDVYNSLKTKSLSLTDDEVLTLIKINSDSTTSETLDETLQSEYFDTIEKRLISFKNWTKTYVSIDDLAKSGLFYLGIDDRVKCFSCGTVLDQWEEGDIPMTEHKKFSPQCPFITQISGSDTGFD
jgi:hypothetical protein